MRLQCQTRTCTGAQVLETHLVEDIIDGGRSILRVKIYCANLLRNSCVLPSWQDVALYVSGEYLPEHFSMKGFGSWHLLQLCPSKTPARTQSPTHSLQFGIQSLSYNPWGSDSIIDHKSNLLLLPAGGHVSSLFNTSTPY